MTAADQPGDDHHMHTQIARSWLVFVLAAALTAIAMLPSTASATFIDPACPAGTPADVACPNGVVPAALAGPRYIGWVYFVEPAAPCFGTGLSFGCGAPAAPMPAWRWTGYQWESADFYGSGWAYVYPFSGQWRWVWRQNTGWLAVNSGRFEIRRY